MCDTCDSGASFRVVLQAIEILPVALCVVSISPTDRDKARMEAARWAGPLLASMVEAPQMKASTVQSELMPWLERGDHERVPGELLDEFVAAGDPEQVQTMISRLLEAGADRVVLVPNPAGFAPHRPWSSRFGSRGRFSNETSSRPRSPLGSAPRPHGHSA
jgi:alkanesulfonate monooxygenase SsuD/methylene tetrahydromethanopterin reductase-like flavin-dependent oxidoreductase (luciferase family)